MTRRVAELHARLRVRHAAGARSPSRAVAFAKARARGSALVLAVALALAWTLAGPAVARADAPPTGEPPAAAGSDWRAWIDADAGFGLLLPPGHRLARASGGAQWYAQGELDGAPLVPDVSITLLAGTDPRQALAEGFPPGATAEPVTLGPATHGLRVTATYVAPDGTPYRSDAYLVETPAGTLRVGRYEGFDWPPFDSVARSLFLTRSSEDAGR